MVSYWKGDEIFQDIECGPQEIILYRYFYYFFNQLKFNKDNFCVTACPYKLFTSQYLRYDDALFLS